MWVYGRRLVISTLSSRAASSADPASLKEVVTALCAVLLGSLAPNGVARVAGDSIYIHLIFILIKFCPLISGRACLCFLGQLI